MIWSICFGFIMGRDFGLERNKHEKSAGTLVKFLI